MAGDAAAFYRDLESIWAPVPGPAGPSRRPHRPVGGGGRPAPRPGRPGGPRSIWTPSSWRGGYARVRLAEPQPAYGWVRAGVYYDPVAHSRERLERPPEPAGGDRPRRGGAPIGTG